MTMPDLQTAMQQILQSWEQPEQLPEDIDMFTPTTNTSRATFEIVRDNPGNTKREYARLLAAKGYKKSSVTTLLAQMIRQGQIWVDSSGLLQPNQTEYKPLKSVKTLANRAKKAKTSKVRTPASNGINALIAEHKEAVRQIEARNNIESILDNISLSDAHELYRKLHQYFGGLPK
jgi:ABC-type oligopeptide transport system ATPase subunit